MSHLPSLGEMPYAGISPSFLQDCPPSGCAFRFGSAWG